jgi:sulfopyruvate decarboxylase TPP-binding subunit
VTEPPVATASRIDGPSLVAALTDCGVTHVVWIPDSELGTWEDALQGSSALQLVRVCREGEAIGVAAGLMLGGRRPVVVVQCTGLFEAGDALRNVVHDLKLPLFLIVGVRGYLAHQRGATTDTCPIFAEPFLKSWEIPHEWLAPGQTAAELVAAYGRAQSARRPAAVLLPE